jgi:hypothetical protein
VNIRRYLESLKSEVDINHLFQWHVAGYLLVWRSNTPEGIGERLSQFKIYRSPKENNSPRLSIKKGTHGGRGGLSYFSIREIRRGCVL